MSVIPDWLSHSISNHIVAIPRRIWIIAALTVVVALVFALDLTPWVRGGYGWRWDYLAVPFARIIPLLLALVVYVTGVWLILRRSSGNSYPWLALLWGLTGTVILSLAVAYAREGDVLFMLFTRTVSLPSSSEWWAGATINWSGGEWQDWTGIMTRYGAITSNVGTSPPGIPLLYGLVTALIGQSPALTDTLYRGLLPLQCHNYELLKFTPAEWGSAWLGMLTPLWAGLAVFPIYGITRHLIPLNRTGVDARLPVLWWALAPGILSFTTSSSTFFPVLALLVFYFLMRGLAGKQPISPSAHQQASDPAFNPESSALSTEHYLLILSAGLIFGIGLFLNFIFLPLAALYGFYTLLHYTLVDRLRGAHWTRPFIVGIIFGLGALIPWIIFYVLTHQTPLDILRVSLNTHLELERPYWYWVWMHIWDWAVFTGFAPVLLWLLSLKSHLTAAWNSILETKSLEAGASEGVPAAPARTGMLLLSLSLLLTVLALTISGTTRGESGRIWLVLSPFALIAAAGVLNRNDRWARTQPVVSDAGLRVGAHGGAPLSPSDIRGVMPPLLAGEVRSGLRSWLILTIAQAVFTLVLAATLAVYNAPDLSHPPAAPAVSDHLTHTTDAVFSGSTGALYRLTGWDADTDSAGRTITLRLNWQGIERPTQPQWFTAILVAPDGSTYPVEPWQPGGLGTTSSDAPRYPTTCWSPGAVIGDIVKLPLPDNASDSDTIAGDWYISLAAFGDETLPDGRLTVTLPDGTTDVQIGLGPITVP